MKDAFNERVEATYDRCPTHDVKILLGNFNANIQFSQQETSTRNGLRLIDFAAARNMVIASTRFKHLNIHKATWMSPDQRTRNQIDHVMIEARHCSSVLDARTFRGVNFDCDHYLVAAKMRMRLSTKYVLLANEN